jgi:hypothetical protein
MTLLSLDPDQLLSTTRAVRKRLDFSRPVPDPLIRECVADVADVLGIPYDTVAQAVLTPLAFTQGTDFKPAARPDPDAVIHRDGW